MRMVTALALTTVWAVSARADSMSVDEYDAVRYQVGCDYETRCAGERKDMFCHVAPDAKKAFENHKKKNQMIHQKVDLDRADWEPCAAEAPKADCKAHAGFEDYLLKDPKCSGVQAYLQHKGKYAIKK